MSGSGIVTVLEFDDNLYKIGDIIHVVYENRFMDRNTIQITGKLLSMKTEKDPKFDASAPLIIVDCSTLYRSDVRGIGLEAIKKIES